MLQYELVVGESYLFDELYGRGIDVLSYFLENPGQIKIDTKAQVSMNYIETGTNNNKSCEEQSIQCRIVGAIFMQSTEEREPRQMDIKSSRGEYEYEYDTNDNLRRTSICHGFNEQFDFPYDTQTKLDQIIENQKK